MNSIWFGKFFVSFTFLLCVTVKAEFANVEDYGANGSDNVDDSTAIPNCLNANSCIYITKGKYYIDQTINLLPTIRMMKGDSLDNTYIYYRGSAGEGHKYNGGSSSCLLLENFTLQNVNTGTIGISLTSKHVTKLSHVRLTSRLWRIVERHISGNPKSSPTDISSANCIYQFHYFSRGVRIRENNVFRQRTVIW